MQIPSHSMQPTDGERPARRGQLTGVRFAVRAGNLGQYSPFVHVALPGQLIDDAWSGMLIALAEPVEAAPDDATIAAEVVETLVVALLGAEADNAIPLLLEAFSNANTWLLAENAKRGTRRKIVLGMSCLLLIGDDLFVAQVPPGQVLIRQDTELFAFPPLESWAASFQPDHTYELPNPLGLRANTEPHIFYTRAEPGDQVFALSSSIARQVRPVQDALCRATGLDQTEHILLDIARGPGIESGYGAVVEVPSERRAGWWKGRRRDEVSGTEPGAGVERVDDALSPMLARRTTNPPFSINLENSPPLPLDQNAPNMQTERAEPVALSWLGSGPSGQPGVGRALPDNSPDDTKLAYDGRQPSLASAPASRPALPTTASVHRESSTPVAVAFVRPDQDAVGILGMVSRFFSNRRGGRAVALNDERA